MVSKGVFSFGWVGIAPTQDAYLAPLFRSTSPDNVTGFNSPDIDAQIAAARANPDDQARQAAYTWIERQVLSASTLVPLAQLRTNQVVADRVHGWSTRLDGTYVVPSRLGDPMTDRTIVIDTADGPMELYEATPDGEVRGAVVVVQEAFGVNDHIKDVTRRFAAVGYHAVAPAFFHRAGGGTGSYDDFATVLPLYEGLTDDGILMDADAAIAHLHDAGFADAQIGTVGFCFGGRVTFLIAAERTLGAAVGFYGGGIVHARFPQFPALVDRTLVAEDAVARAVRRQGHGHPDRGCRDAAYRARRRTGRWRDRAVCRCRARLPLRRASRRTTPRPPPTAGTAPSPGSTSTSPTADPVLTVQPIRYTITTSIRISGDLRLPVHLPGAYRRIDPHSGSGERRAKVTIRLFGRFGWSGPPRRSGGIGRRASLRG